MPNRTRFLDAVGTSWTVYEVVAGPQTADDQRPRLGRLYFFARYATRRLLEYPVRWAELSAAELRQLCARAEPIRDVPPFTGEFATRAVDATPPAP